MQTLRNGWLALTVACVGISCVDARAETDTQTEVETTTTETATAPEEATTSSENGPTLLDRVRGYGNDVFQGGKEAADTVSRTLDETRFYRAKSKWTLSGKYSPFETWIPSKYGASLAYTPSVESTWELEYMRGSIPLKFFVIDIGEMVEQKFSLVYRSYSDRNSFHFFGGAFYHSFKARLGNTYLSLVPNSPVQGIDLVQIRTWGVVGGVGNRWQFKSGWGIGVDWFTIAIPLKTIQADAPYITTATNGSKREDVQDVFDVIRKVPTFAFFKVQFGYSF